jgi:3-oxoacid CoA-transferase
MIITELAVFRVDAVRGLVLEEIGEGVGVEEVRAKTGCRFEVSEKLKVF